MTVYDIGYDAGGNALDYTDIVTFENAASDLDVGRLWFSDTNQSVVWRETIETDKQLSFIGMLSGPRVQWIPASWTDARTLYINQTAAKSGDSTISDIDFHAGDVETVRITNSNAGNTATYTVTRCMIHAGPASGFRAYNKVTVDFVWCIGIAGGANGIFYFQSVPSGQGRVANCAVFGGAIGFRTYGSANVLAVNNVAIGSATCFDAASGGSWSASSGYNVASDATSPGSNNTDNQALADIGVLASRSGPTYGIGLDMRMDATASSILEDAGTTVSGLTEIGDTDIDGREITTGHMPIGCSLPVLVSLDADEILTTDGGDVVLPAVEDVRADVTYGADSELTGTLTVDEPDPENVTEDDTTGGVAGLIPLASVLVSAGGTLTVDEPDPANVTEADTTGGVTGSIPLADVLTDSGGTYVACPEEGPNGVTYGAGGTEYTLDVPFTSPDVPIFTVTESDGAVTVTISGSDSATHTAKTLAVDSTSWTDRGSVSGDGSIEFELDEGYYWITVEADLGGVVVCANPSGLQVDDDTFSAPTGFFGRMLRQTAVYWPPSGWDDYGKPNVSTPYEISCRWEDVVEEFVDSDGTRQMSRAKVFVDRELNLGGVLYLGRLAGVGDLDDPKENDGAYEIRKVDALPNLKATQTLRTVYL